MLVDVPAVERPYDYSVPEALVGRVEVGTMVRVPFHGRRVAGWVLDQILVMLHPFMPFVTEELWSKLGDRPYELIVAQWPQPQAEVDAGAKAEVDWLIALIESSINLHHGLDGDYDLVPNYYVSGDPGWKPRGHYPIVRGTTDLAGSGRPVALVRELGAAVESQIHKVQRDGSVAQIERVRSLAMKSVGFVEHWQAMAARRGSDVLVLRFEDLIADPGTSLQRVSDHWSLDLDASAIGQAIELSDRRRMTAKTGDDRTNVRVTIDVPDVDPTLAAVVREVIRSSSLDGAFGYAPLDD